jgi:RNA polymerase sigma-70 factor (ECF subfamily)
MTRERLSRPHASAPFAEFYDAMFPVVLRFFARRARQPEAAFDLTAETFAKAFEKRADFRGSTELQATAWLWAIARNELARYHRSRSVELAALRRLGLERPVPSDEELRIVEELTAAEDVRGQIHDALASLPPEQREVVKLRVFDELSYPEIAETLGVSYDVVRARHSRALRTLRASEQMQAAVRVLEA